MASWKYFPGALVYIRPIGFVPAFFSVSKSDAPDSFYPMINGVLEDRTHSSIVLGGLSLE